MVFLALGFICSLLNGLWTVFVPLTFAWNKAVCIEQKDVTHGILKDHVGNPNLRRTFFFHVPDAARKEASPREFTSPRRTLSTPSWKTISTREAPPLHFQSLIYGWNQSSHEEQQLSVNENGESRSSQ
jgi:hypothetical protein